MELLEIEKELSGPEKEAALARYDAVLIGLGERLEGSLRQGVPPIEYGRCEALKEAVVVARKLLRLQVKRN